MDQVIRRGAWGKRDPSLQDTGYTCKCGHTRMEHIQQMEGEPLGMQHIAQCQKCDCVCFEPRDWPERRIAFNVRQLGAPTGLTVVPAWLEWLKRADKLVPTHWSAWGYGQSVRAHVPASMETAAEKLEPPTLCMKCKHPQNLHGFDQDTGTSVCFLGSCYCTESFT